MRSTEPSVKPVGKQCGMRTPAPESSRKSSGGLRRREDVRELAREVFAVVDVEVQRLEVVAEVHLAQRGHAAGELGQGHAQRQRAEDPVLLRELAAPEVFFLFGQMLETHQRTDSIIRSNSSRPPNPSMRARSPVAIGEDDGRESAHAEALLQRVDLGRVPPLLLPPVDDADGDEALVDLLRDARDCWKTSASSRWQGAHQSAVKSNRIGLSEFAARRSPSSGVSHCTRAALRRRRVS